MHLVPRYLSDDAALPYQGYSIRRASAWTTESGIRSPLECLEPLLFPTYLVWQYGTFFYIGFPTLPATTTRPLIKAERAGFMNYSCRYLLSCHSCYLCVHGKIRV